MNGEEKGTQNPYFCVRAQDDIVLQRKKVMA